MSETPTLETDASCKNLWDDREAAALEANPLELLRYRSNLLGADLRITNFGGGNTSSKFDLPDPLTGEPRRVMAVKGSGGDLRSIGTSGFAVLYLDKLERARSRAIAARRTRTRWSGSIRSARSARTASPRRSTRRCTRSCRSPHVDHLHPDWAIALAASANGQQKLDEFNTQYGRRIVWVPWQRPGLRAGADAAQRGRGDTRAATASCSAATACSRGATTQQRVLSRTASRPSIRWASSSQDHAQRARHGRSFGGARPRPRRPIARRSSAAILPYLRGVVSSNRRVIAHFDGRTRRSTFANSRWAERLCQLGTSCPGSLPAHAHLADVRAVGRREPRTSRRCKTRIAERLVQYREDYAAYYQAHARPDSPALRDSNPSVVVIPGLGLFGFGKDKREARITTEFFVNAIHVMAGANALEDDGGTAQARCRRRGTPEQATATSRASTTTSRCRGPRRSGSSTGRSRKPSCSGCRPSGSSAARSSSSSAAAAASAAKWRCSSRRRGAHVVVADMNVASAEDGREGGGDAVVAGDGAGGARST